MALLRSTYGTRRLAVVLFALLLAALFLLPSQSQGLLQLLGGPEAGAREQEKEDGNDRPRQADGTYADLEELPDDGHISVKGCQN